jgi:hypothetical protein
MRPRFSVCIAGAVLLARSLTSGPAYYSDAGRHLQAIADHTFVIQPPGYWLFNRVGGLFADPELGLLILNWCFSALGCVAFYACARRLVRSPLARLGTVLYATAFFAWFSGNVHSTYASQLLFPPLMFYFILRFQESPQTQWLLGVAASFALGAGFRPSDGVFLAPLLLLFALQLSRKHQLMLLASVSILCLAWLIPNRIALHRYSPIGHAEQLTHAATGAIVLGRINAYTISNAFRFFLPLVVALGPTAWFISRARDAVARQLWAWVLPGSAFFLLVFISDAPYLDCLLGGFVLLCLLGMNACRNRVVPVVALTFSIVVNVLFFTGFHQLPPQNAVSAVIDRDLGLYTLDAVRHQTRLRLIDVIKAQ